MNWTRLCDESDAVVANFIQVETPEERPGLRGGMREADKPGGLLLQGDTPKHLEVGKLLRCVNTGM